MEKVVDKFDEWSIGHKDYYGAVRCRIHPSVKSILMEEGASSIRQSRTSSEALVAALSVSVCDHIP